MSRDPAADQIKGYASAAPKKVRPKRSQKKICVAVHVSLVLLVLLLQRAAS
jgi:hypothetical protein